MGFLFNDCHDMHCILGLHYSPIVLFVTVFWVNIARTGSPSRAMSPSNSSNTSAVHKYVQGSSGGRSHEVPDLNELASEGIDHTTSTSTGKKVQFGDTSKESKMALRERLREESRIRKNKRRSEKRKLLPNEEKEKVQQQNMARSSTYRAKLKEKIGYSNLQLARYHELKKLKQDGKASVQQIQELYEYIRRTRKTGKESKARIRAKKKAEKKD